MSKEVFHHVPVCTIEDFQRVPGGTAEAFHPFPGGTDWTIFRVFSGEGSVEDGVFSSPSVSVSKI